MSEQGVTVRVHQARVVACLRRNATPVSKLNQLQVQVGSLHFPRVNETQEDARIRFQKAIEALSGEHKGGVLVVTHGDALGAIVEHAIWNSVVYQVDTTGYVTMKRRLEGDLEVLSAEGVSWMAD
jgi:broad specificity phosphatase PhoE